MPNNFITQIALPRRMVNHLDFELSKCTSLSTFYDDRIIYVNLRHFLNDQFEQLYFCNFFLPAIYISSSFVFPVLFLEISPFHPLRSPESFFPFQRCQSICQAASIKIELSKLVDYGIWLHKKYFGTS
uniref:Uncharacterized protein n=1 Tax=Rhizophagus irregularis (strain DAOM 181602 / DAOM 197198 / MUCL 43194) TaxID=747089 RepID=U9SNJ8_RHIID